MKQHFKVGALTEQMSVTGAQFAPMLLTTAAGFVCLPTTPVGAAYLASNYAATSLIGYSLPATLIANEATFLASNRLPESWSTIGSEAYELISKTAQSTTSSEVDPTNNTESNQATVDSSNNNSVLGGQPSSYEENGNSSSQDASEPNANGAQTTKETVFSALYSFFRPSPPQKAKAHVSITPAQTDNDQVKVDLRITFSTP